MKNKTSTHNDTKIYVVQLIALLHRARWQEYFSIEEKFAMNKTLKCFSHPSTPELQKYMLLLAYPNYTRTHSIVPYHQTLSRISVCFNMVWNLVEVQGLFIVEVQDYIAIQRKLQGDGCNYLIQTPLSIRMPKCELPMLWRLFHLNSKEAKIMWPKD